MTSLLEKYGLDKISPDEKSLLIFDLEESLSRDVEAESESPEVLAMLAVRIARIDAELALGIDNSVPWEVVSKEIDDWLDQQ